MWWYRARPNNGYRQRLNTEIICVLLSENDLKLQLLIIGTDGTGNDVSPENAISNEMKNVCNDAPTIFSQSTVICVFDKCRSHDSDHNMKSILWIFIIADDVGDIVLLPMYTMVMTKMIITTMVVLTCFSWCPQSHCFYCVSLFELVCVFVFVSVSLMVMTKMIIAIVMFICFSW